MTFKKVLFYFIVCVSFILMFMNYLITGFALLFLSAFIFAPGKMKRNEKWHRFYNGGTIKKIRKWMSIIIFLSIVLLLFIYPKLNMILPLFFIAVILSPSKKKTYTDYSDYND